MHGLHSTQKDSKRIKNIFTVPVAFLVSFPNSLLFLTCGARVVLVFAHFRCHVLEAGVWGQVCIPTKEHNKTSAKLKLAHRKRTKYDYTMSRGFFLLLPIITLPTFWA